MASASISLPLPGDQGSAPSHGGGLRARFVPLNTIIMPIRNETRSMAGALHAVLAQDDPGDKVDIFVVDGMSEDGTRAIVTAMAVGEPRVPCMDHPERIGTVWGRAGSSSHPAMETRAAALGLPRSTVCSPRAQRRPCETAGAWGPLTARPPTMARMDSGGGWPLLESRRVIRALCAPRRLRREQA